MTDHLTHPTPPPRVAREDARPRWAIDAADVRIGDFHPDQGSDFTPPPPPPPPPPPFETIESLRADLETGAEASAALTTGGSISHEPA